MQNQLEGRLSQVLDSEQTPEKRDEIFKRFVGDEGHGRVRTYGFGPSPTDVYRRLVVAMGPSEQVMANLRQNIREEMREEMEAQQARFRTEMEAQMQARFDEMRATFMAEMMGRNINPSDLTTPPSSTGQVVS